MSVISLGALVSVSFFAYMSNNKEKGGIGGIVTIRIYFLHQVLTVPKPHIRWLLLLWCRYARKFTVVYLQKHTRRLTGLVIKQTRKQSPKLIYISAAKSYSTNGKRLKNKTRQNETYWARFVKNS